MLISFTKELCSSFVFSIWFFLYFRANVWFGFNNSIEWITLAGFYLVEHASQPMPSIWRYKVSLTMTFD